MQLNNRSIKPVSAGLLRSLWLMLKEAAPLASLVLCFFSTHMCYLGTADSKMGNRPVGNSDAGPEKQKNLPLTYYTAKQAFAHLSLFLSERQRPAPKRIWYAIPERTALYSYGEDMERRLGGIVGGWIFGYEDQAG